MKHQNNYKWLPVDMIYADRPLFPLFSNQYLFRNHILPDLGIFQSHILHLKDPEEAIQKYKQFQALYPDEIGIYAVHNMACNIRARNENRELHHSNNPIPNGSES